MDEMKIKLSTKFMRGIVSKMITKAIHKKYGYKVTVNLNDLDVSFMDGETNLHANVDVKMDRKEFMNLIGNVETD